MDFSEFKKKYIKIPVIEYPNNRKGKIPLVTVKVVTYNHVNYIKQCLDSILMQKTDFDFEILIAEDASNDGTREVCKEYADKYPDRIRLFLNSRENNYPLKGKPSGIINNTYANFLIQSKYYAILEGDDYWTDEYSLQRRVDFLEKNDDYVICFHNAKIYYENIKEFDTNLKCPLTASSSLDKEMIFNIAMPTLSRLYRNVGLEVFEEEMLEIVSGDTVLKGKLAHFGKVRYLNEIKPAVYRVHKGGTYSSQNDNYKKFARLEYKIYLLEYYNKNNWDMDYLQEKLFLTYITLFMNDIIIRKKLNFQNLKKGLVNFIKSRHKRYCIVNLSTNIKTSLKK